MHDLQLVGFTTDRRGLIFRTQAGARVESYVVPVTDDLVRLVGQLAESTVDDGPPAMPDEVVAPVVAVAERRAESQLSVRDIQARLRAGEPIPRVAAEAGVADDWIERFAPPIRAEQRRVVERAQQSHLQRSRAGVSALPLRRAVGMAMADKGIAFTVAAFEAAWSARLLGHDRWAVEFTYHHRGQDRTVTWDFDATSDSLSANDRAASQIGFVDPDRRPDDDTGIEVDGIVGAPDAKTQIGTATARGRATPPVAAAQQTADGGESAAASAGAASATVTTPKASTRKKASRKQSVPKQAASTKRSSKKTPTATQAAKKAAKPGTTKRQAAKKTAKPGTTSKRAAKKAAKPGTTKRQAAKKTAEPGTTSTQAGAKRAAPTKERAPKAEAATKRPAKTEPAEKPSTARKPSTQATQATRATPATRRAAGSGNALIAKTVRKPVAPTSEAPPAAVRSAAASKRTVADTKRPIDEVVAPSVAPQRTAPPTSNGARTPLPPAAPASVTPASTPEPQSPEALDRLRAQRVADRLAEEGDRAASPTSPTPPTTPAGADRTAARRARAAERSAPTVQFRSGSAAPVRVVGATEPSSTPAPRSADPAQTGGGPNGRPAVPGARADAPGGAAPPADANGAARPRTRRRRQLRAR